ncbi:MAG: hypothetical protein IKG14_04745 [Clostridia bacterium]|nr:hypothetical protein [Clostridia bacterium]
MKNILKNAQENSKGITLIALVVTIIVLLILSGIVLTILLSDNGLITKAIESSFRTEMSQIKENVNYELASCEIDNTKIDSKFEKVTFEDAKEFDEYLKLELIYWGHYEIDYQVTKLSRNYIKQYGDNILESHLTDINGTSYIKDLFYVNKTTANGKEEFYLYDKFVNQVYKVPLTTIGSHKVHSIEELDYQKQNGNGERDLTLGTITEETSSIIRLGNIAFYEPELRGFAKDKTNAVYYEKNDDGTINSNEETVKIEDYINNKETSINKNDKTYTFFDYENQIWANIKVINDGIETNWTWIPRYAYKIENSEINVIYVDINNKQALTGEDLPQGYIVHSAFEENNKKGIWVSKYEIEVAQNSTSGDFPYYIPDVTGFDKNSTYVEVMNDDGSFTETKLSDINNLGEFAKNNRWFDYDNQIWANIKTNANDAECWWVWIPRYAYSITGTSTSIVFVDVNNKSLSGEELDGSYIIHPAFEDGKKGIWVSKYEISHQIVDIPTTNNVAFPDLTGFDQDNTYIEEYKDDGTFNERKLSTIENIQEYSTNKKWFDYSKQIWANIKTNANGKECWWVWIPKYAYNITGEETRVIFLDENGNTLDGSTIPANYIPHPAFGDGKKGIWVSKYEISEE